tara:strand:- start:51 stop:152 length:102 start_codon:yes stop_codon:yes gene_type:complete
MGALATGTVIYFLIGVLATVGSYFVPAARSDRG